MFIYKIVNKINGKIYVGQTSKKTIGRRFSSHKNLLNKNKHHNKHLQRSWLKHGEKSFVFEIIEIAINREQLDFLESYWILFYNSRNPKKGFNKESGGNRNKSCGPAWNKGLPKEKQSMFGKRHSEETRARQSESAKNRSYSEEEIERARTNGKRVSKPILCLNNGIIYASRSEAAKLLGITRANIAPVLSGKKKTVGGYKFKDILKD